MKTLNYSAVSQAAALTVLVILGSLLLSGGSGNAQTQSAEADTDPVAECQQCHGDAMNPAPAATVDEKQGLEAWERIFEVTSHPRCANCHVGEDNIPMWSGPSYGETRPHGMNINAGESRIGAETITCTTCHTNTNNPLAHGAPGNEVWHLPPVEMQWFGRSSAEVCAQLKNPDTNGDRTFAELAKHVGHDDLVLWGWKPGTGREPAPYSASEHAGDILTWGAAGQPCPTN